MSLKNIQVYGRSQSQLINSDRQPEHCTGAVAGKFLDTSNNTTNRNKDGFGSNIIYIIKKYKENLW